ncbi:MAG: DEAD/DEAH box helicase [Phycisphaerae bacterium]|nr:DEAD/DEAH box helicase [Phycisphaerae bacterium]
MHARKSAEAICSTVLAREIGDPGNNRLDKLIELLSDKDRVPERVKIPLRVIQQYGNYGAHFQGDEHSITRAYIDPCLAALIHVANWYFLEYLRMEIPAAVAEANNEFEPQAAVLAEPEVSVDDPDGLSAELKLPAPLRSYQWEGVSFLARNTAALLADEMGLGKTVQSIVALRLLLRQSPSGRVLVITPNALAYNWERELATWAPDLVVRRVTGTAEDRLATYQLPIQVLIATYEQIRADALDMDPDIHFDVLVLDEAQRIKNRHSRAALGCRMLRRTRAWILTGTPLENSVEDLVSLFVLLSPGLVDSGMPPAEVHRRIQPHFLRRRKKDVLAEMPPIIMQDMMLELAGAQDAAYTDLWVNRRTSARQEGVPVSDLALFALLTKLKQLCNYEPTTGESVKSEALGVVLEECTETDDKVIVFSQYVETLKFIAGGLGTFAYDIYTGEQSQEEKDDVLARFRQLPGPRALLMSLRAGGVGLNIQEASTVVLFDRWWNPAVENQAIQRAHRFGRTRPLHVIRFLVAGTIEERIAEVLKDKEADFERYIEGADNAPVKLFTRDELRKVLALTVVDTDAQRA